MRILFCSDALIVDGVTSFVFHLSVALKKGGHKVAVLGRWAGKGYQTRLRDHGVDVIQCLSPTVGNFWFDSKARFFKPDVIITDSRRSFPLAARLKKVTGAKVLTFFLDELVKTDRKGRDVESLIRYSDAWLSAEPPLLEKLDKIPTPFPKFLFRRPLVGLIEPAPLNSRDPFRIFCLGRLSGYKSAGAWDILRNAIFLKNEIPSLEIAFAGGGWRAMKFWCFAQRSNFMAGEKFLHVLGTQTDPQPWFDWSTLVCAGSTSAVEAILANRPLINFSARWLGFVTPEKVEEGFATYFAERSKNTLVRENPGLVIKEILRIYNTWDSAWMGENVVNVREMVEPHFHGDDVGENLESILKNLE